MVVVYILLALLCVCFLTALICFFRVFYARPRKPVGADEFPIPEGEIYEPFRAEMTEWTRRVREMPHEEMTVTSFDGLTLRGSYYEYEKGATVEILFHGYKGTAERDLCGAVERCFALGRNALIVDQRASGLSDGRVITFGVNERKDVLKWIELVLERFGPETQICLAGVSMGAATVMMAAGEDLPENVVCVLADCGYSTARDIICKIIREMHLPVRLLYPFVRLGARIFGRFDLEETTPLEAVQRSRVPILFVHGDVDAFVPCEMSRILHEACASEKKAFVVIPGAGHGLAYPAAKVLYLSSVRDFQSLCGF